MSHTFSCPRNDSTDFDKHSTSFLVETPSSSHPSDSAHSSSPLCFSSCYLVLCPTHHHRHLDCSRQRLLVCQTQNFCRASTHHQERPEGTVQYHPGVGRHPPVGRPCSDSNARMLVHNAHLPYSTCESNAEQRHSCECQTCL